MSSFPHAAFRGCKFLLEAAKATPKAAAATSSKNNKVTATTSSKYSKPTSAVKQQQGVRTPSARRPTVILKASPVSPELQSFLGVSETCRSDAVKKIWGYIKLHNLQNPANKREINCDHKLKTLLGGKDKVGFLEISKLLSAHFVKSN